MKRSNSLPAQRTVGFFFKTTVLAATLGIANSVNNELGERRAASIFLRSRHIDSPPFQLIDRLSSWDADNWSLLGGAAGLFAANRRPCPLPSISRTLWYGIHIMSGVWVGGWGFFAQEIATVGPKLIVQRTTQDKPIRMLQKASYQPEVLREALLDFLNSEPGALTHVQRGMIKLSPEMVDALRESATLRPYDHRKPKDASQTAIERFLKAPNQSDSFHKTHQPPGKYEPVPYPERNYDWSCSSLPARAIPELEEHITQLRSQRQQICKEAEAVRNWLREREAAYHKLKSAASGLEPNELRIEKLYLEVLGH